MNLRKAAEMALEFVDWLCSDDHSVKPKNKALDVREALRQALAQPEQEPVAWIFESNYIAPPKHEWVGLTDEERVSFFTKSQNKFWDWDDGVDIEAFIRAIEAKLKEKNK